MKSFALPSKTGLFTLGLLMGVAMLTLSEPSFAGGGGQEFDDVWITLEEWTQGTLGRIISLSIILVGAVMGVVRQSLMTFAVGFAMGMGLYNAPTIVDALVGATLANLDKALPLLEATQQIGNGLSL